MLASFLILAATGTNSKRNLLINYFITAFYSSAMAKSESHKGKNEDENIVIWFYYNNKIFFSTLVVGSEACTVVLYLFAKIPAFRENIYYCALTAILCSIMATKMIVNVFQW